MKYQNIVERFYHLVKEFPSATLFTYLDDNGKEQESLTISRFASQVETIASAIVLDHGISTGDHVALVYPPGLDFIKAFWACVIIGAIPVPLAPNIMLDVDKMKKLVQTSKSKIVLLNQAAYSAIFIQAMKKIQFAKSSEYSDVAYVLTDGLKDSSNSSGKIVPYTKAATNDICFLQYTSGSTSAPKGVMISYGNLSHQLSVNLNLLDRTDLLKDPSNASKNPIIRNRSLIWLPANHDFCLISFILSSLWGNGSLYLFSPVAFVKRPALWFELMTKNLITHSAGPNFAFDLSVRKTTPAERANYNLSRLRVLMCAAEPISYGVVQKFIHEFTASKFNKQAFCSAYGMAENSVAISVAGKLNICVDRMVLEKESKLLICDQALIQNEDKLRVLVGCGIPVTDTVVRIVDVNTFRAVPDGHIGEIWVFSPSTALGYYEMEELSKETFHAQMVDRSEDLIEPNKYLRTGDLGCIFEGEIFVTGRLKDMIIFAGRNVYPQDIEESIRHADDIIRKGGVAVISLSKSEYAATVGEQANYETEEHIVAVVETVRDISEKENSSFISIVRKVIQKNHQISGSLVVFCKPGSIAKTTSGKVQRSLTKQKLLKGEIVSSVKSSSSSGSFSILNSVTSLANIAYGLFSTNSLSSSPSALGSSIWKLANVKPTSRTPSSNQNEVEVNGKDRMKRVLNTENMESSFREIIAKNSSFFMQYSKYKKGKVFHNKSTGLLGSLTFKSRLPDELVNSFLATEGKLTCLIRFANGVQDDDRVPDVRGATVRIFKNDDFEDPIWDLIMATGSAFPARSAQDFETWRTSTYQQRLLIATERPNISHAAWNQYRLIESYSDIYYYSVTTYELRTFSESGKLETLNARFRLVPATKNRDCGFLSKSDNVLPAENYEVDPSDSRKSDFLHSEIKSKLEKNGVHFILQIQCAKKGRDEIENDLMLDCSTPWSEDQYPWIDLANLKFNEVITRQERLDSLDFNIVNSPTSIQVPLAVSPDSCASLSHLRMIVYYLASLSRHGVGESSLPSMVKKLIILNDIEKKQKSLKVAILGAGVCGLTAGYELKKLGHSPSVFEKENFLGGKCGSVEIEGKPYDWGGHVCTDMYKTLIKVMEELEITETEGVTPTKIYDIEKRSIEDQEKSENLKSEFFKYSKLRESNFPKINSSNLIDVVKYKPLVQPIETAAKALGIENLIYEVGLRFTSCGYGFATDKDLPLMYALKAAETAAILSTGNSEKAWTVQGGFGAFWEKVAGKVGDVRLKTFPSKVIRTNSTGVVLKFGDGHEENFDKVIITTGKRPEVLGKAIDLSEDEISVFSHIRSFEYYTTAVQIQGVIPELGFHVYKQYCETEDFIGYPVCYHHRYSGVNNVLVYSYGDEKHGKGGDYVIEKLKFAFKEMGAKVSKVYWQKKWDYFPHFTSSSIDNGVQAKLEALQGKNNTFYSGSIFNFELIECNMSHVTSLIDKFFAPQVLIEKSTVKAAFFEEYKETEKDSRYHLVLDYIKKEMKTHLKTVTGTDQDISEDHSFADYGFDSITSIRLANVLSQGSGLTLQPVVFFENPTPIQLATFLYGLLETKIGHLENNGGALSQDLYKEDEPIEIGKNGKTVIKMNVFRPTTCFNGFAIFELLSGGYHSGTETIDLHKFQGNYSGFCGKGFTIFSAMIGSIDSETIYDMLDNAYVALEWVKSNTNTYGVDARKLTLLAQSSGGHLASLLMLNVHPKNPKPSSGFQSYFKKSAKAEGNIVGAILYAPITDSLNENGMGGEESEYLRKLFFQESMDEEILLKRRAEVSPFHNTKSVPQTLNFLRIYHAEKDPIISSSFSFNFVQNLKDRVKDAEFLEVPAIGHPWKDIYKDFVEGASIARSKLLKLDISSEIRILSQIDSNSENIKSLDELTVSFANQWKHKPSLLLGTLNIWCLAFVLRISLTSDKRKPRFPDLIEKSISRMNTDGIIGVRYAHPYCEWISNIAFANSLIIWHNYGFSDYSKPIQKILSYAIDECLPNFQSYDEKHVTYFPMHTFGGFPGAWLLPEKEAKPLLNSTWLSDDQKERLKIFLSQRSTNAAKELPEEAYKKLFEETSLSLVFGEYFPEHVLKSEYAAKQILKTPHFQAGLLLKYFELTKDARLEPVIQSLNFETPFQNLMPKQSKLNENLFSLHYLVRGGVDVKKYFPDKVSYLLEIFKEDGVPVEEGQITADSDCTGVAQFVANKLNLKTPFKTCSFEKWWKEENQNYENTDRANSLVTTVLCNVLDAYLSDPSVNLEEKLFIWKRVVNILERNVWNEIYHLSPFYVWKRIIYTFFTYRHLFPSHKTNIQVDALNAMLALFDPAVGGFTSKVIGQPVNLEESSLGLLCIKYVLEAEDHGLSSSKIDVLKSVAYETRKYIQRKLGNILEAPEKYFKEEYPEFFSLKVSGAMPNLTNAMAVAALR